MPSLYRCLNDAGHTFTTPPRHAQPNPTLFPLCPECSTVSLPYHEKDPAH